MAFKIFVGNLSWNATEEALQQLFEEFGAVVSVRIVTDPYTGRSRGFGFVEMEAEDALNQAVEKLDNFQFLNRPIRVSRARQEERRPGGGNGGRREGGPRQDRRPGGNFRGGHEHQGARAPAGGNEYDDNEF